MAAGALQSLTIPTIGSVEQPSDSGPIPHQLNQLLKKELSQDGQLTSQRRSDKARDNNPPWAEYGVDSFLPPPTISISERMEEAPNPDTMDQSASFFDPENAKASHLREELAMATLDELLDYILEEGGSVGIFDATNSTLERRKTIMQRVRERAGPELGVLFLESLCIDENVCS